MLTGVRSFDFSNETQLVQLIPNGENVSGLTCLGEEVIVVRKGEAEVEVYDVNSITKLRRLPVGLSWPREMTSCTQKNCLFIINCDRRLYRVDLNGRVTSWEVSGEGLHLSMAAKCNVLVTFKSASKFKAVTQNG